MFVLAIIIVLYFWKLTLTTQYTWLSSPDFAYQVMPWFQAEMKDWHHHTFPAWDPHLWGGMPFIGQMQPGPLNPINWILFSLPRSHGFITVVSLHWYFVALHFAGAMFCYLLCRDLRRSRTASIIGGLAYGLAGFMGTNMWPQMLSGAVWLPLALMFTLRAVRGRRPLFHGAIAGVIWGLSIWSGHHNVPVFALVALTGLWVYAIARNWRRSIGAAAAFFVCGALVAAPQMLPAREFGQLSVRWVGASHPLGWNETVPYSIHEGFSLDPAALPGIVVPNVRQDSGVFVGLVILSLAVIAIAREWRRRAVRVLAAFAAGGLALALGGSSLLYGILYALMPGFEKARSPHMASVILGLGLAVLAAYGYDSVRRASRVSRIVATKWIVRALAALAVTLIGVLIAGQALHIEGHEAYHLMGLTTIAAALLATLYFSWSRGRLSNGIAGAALILLALFEFNGVSNRFPRRDSAGMLDQLGRHDDIASFLRSRPEPVRVEVNMDQIPYNFGDWHGIDAMDGYVASMLTAVSDVQGDPRMRMLLATNYSIGKDPTRADQKPVFQGSSGLRVFENPAALPRVRTVHEIRRLEPGVLSNPAIDLARVALLDGAPPQLDGCDGDRVAVKQYNSNSVVITADMRCRGMVVLADTWFPGWNAYVDGRAVELYRPYGLVRGVVVETGTHQVEMRYSPSSLLAGAGLCGLGLLLCGALWFIDRKKAVAEAVCP